MNGENPGRKFLLAASVVALTLTLDAAASPSVPSYITFDTRLAWQPIPNLELSLVGQNLWDNHHPEFGPVATRQEIPRVCMERSYGASR